MPDASSKKGRFARFFAIHSIHTRAACSRHVRAAPTVKGFGRLRAQYRRSEPSLRGAPFIPAVPVASNGARRPHRPATPSDRTISRAVTCTIQLMAFVEVSHLVKHFVRPGGLFRAHTVVKAVDDVTFQIDEGETFGLVGESGSGKTTTGRCMLRLVDATSGDVRFRGEPVLGATRSRMREMRRELQIVFQDPYSSLNPRMRAREIVEEPLIIHRLPRAAPPRARARAASGGGGLAPGAARPRYSKSLSSSIGSAPAPRGAGASPSCSGWWASTRSTSSAFRMSSA